MTCPALLLLTAGLVLAEPPADVKKELEKFQGTWKMVRLDVDGTSMPAEALHEIQLTIKGEQFTASDGKTNRGGTFTIAPGKKPRQIEVTFTDGPEKGRVSPGIYEIEGDTYRICVDMAGKGRPTAFAAPPGSGHALEVYQRVKR